jgi:HPt (histidine-containing phosphotransfer) domain-containing protein
MAAESNPTLDPEAIELLRSLGSDEDRDDFLREVVGIFLVDTPNRIDEMENAYQAGDAQRFMRTAHSLKGSSANIGAIEVKNLSGILELRSREAGLAGLQPILADLRVAFDRAKEAFGLLLAVPPAAG